MKRVLVMALLLIAAMSLALTRGLPKEQDILMPHASASPGKTSVSDERVVLQGSGIPGKNAKEIRVIKKGDNYLLQIKHASLPMEEYELTAGEKSYTQRF
jgi:hypothetical protein